LNEHYSGLTLFVDDPRIPMDNNYGERLIRNPAVGRKNYYGSGAEWSGRLAMMLFSLFATLALWQINPRKWLNYYFDACAASDGEVPNDPASFLPWNSTEDCLAELRSSASSRASPDTS
jgi:transposase